MKLILFTPPTFNRLCKKKNFIPAIVLCILLQFNTTLAQVDCTHTSTGNIPINDLGTGYFLGEQGGLYPGGSNTIPVPHAKAGASIGNSIKPLNAAGAVDLVNGKVVFAAFGASTAGRTFNTFTTTVNTTEDLYNPCLQFVNLCMGGKGLETMIPPGHDWYWDFIADTLMNMEGLTAEQVQIGWIKTASKDDSIPEFPLQADSIYSKYVKAIQRLKVYFPNLKLLYISSHAYGGYASDFAPNADLAGEPAAYYGGFGVKWTIAAQITGDPRLKYKGTGILAPWIAWGPYFWADGINPRVSDGLVWLCSDYDPLGGGFHLSEEGKIKESDMMINFFYNDSSSKKWFRNGPSWASCDPEMRTDHPDSNPEYAQFYDDELMLYPSPNTGNFYVSFYQIDDAVIRIFNSSGDKVYEQQSNGQTGDVTYHISIQTLPAGIYFIQVLNGGKLISKSFNVD